MYLKLFSKDSFFVGFIIICFTLLYTSTLPHTNVGYSDSDQLLAVAYNNGVAHPPGYPLYVFLLNIWLHLPLPGSIAFQGHLLSTIFSVLSLVIVYKTIRYLQIRFPFPLPTSIQKFIALFSVSLLGISPLFWQYSVITEVFSLNNLIAVSLIYKSVVAVLSPWLNKRFWIESAVILALALAHHHTIILLAPLIALAIFSNLKRITRHQLIQSFATFILVLVSAYSLLTYQSSTNANLSWQMDPGFPGLLRHIFRQEFSGVTPETGQVVNAYLPQIEPQKILDHFPIYLGHLNNQFMSLGILLSLLGLYYFYRSHRLLFTVYLLTLLITGPFFSGILGWPDHFGTQSNIERLHLLGYLFFPILIAFGTSFLIYRLAMGFSVLGIRESKTNFTILLFIFSSLIIKTAYQYPKSDLSNFKFIAQTYSKILEQVEPNALLACFTDTSCFALLYEQTVNQKRPDVIILPRAYPLVKSRLSNITNLRNFNYDSDPFRTFDYITWNIGKRPVYVVEISEFYYHLLGINEGFTYYIPLGIYGQLTRTQPDAFPPSDFELSNSILQTPIPSSDRMRLYFLSNVIRTYQFNSVIQLKSGYRDQARQELNIAGNLDDILRLQEPIETNFEQVRRSIESSRPDPRFSAGKQPIPLSEFISLIQQWKDKRRLDVAHKLAVGAMAVYPDQVEARLAAAKTFREINQFSSSIMEYSNVLVLDPDNEIAIQALKELQNQSSYTSPPTLNL